ncbi:MAG: diguanylate cyclase domain-containing protein [Candidatus Baltobacteraceae bacterium]
MPILFLIEGRATRMAMVGGERARLRHLYKLELLDTPPEPAYDAFTQLAAQICGTPISLISLIDKDRQWFKSNLGLEGIRETARDVAFCSEAIQSHSLLEVQDAAADARFKDNPLVTGEPNIRFYAGAPLIVGDGHAIGSLCVIDRVARKLSDAQRSQFRLLGTALQTLIDSRVGAKMREQYESTLRSEKHKIEVTLSTLADAVITTDRHGIVELVNTAAERLLHLRAGLLTGRPLRDHLVIETFEKHSRIDILKESRKLAKERAILRQGNGPQVQIEFEVANLMTPEGQPGGHVITMRDVTQEVAQAAKLSYEASHDELTDLYNRRQFELCLAKTLSSARREQKAHTLTYLDLDRFKSINETHGHAAGDFFLTELARQLRKTMRGNDVLARIGGDEFAFIMHDCHAENAKPVLEALERTISLLKVPWENAMLSVGVSYGTIEIDKNTLSVAEALRAAERRCYEGERAAALT